MPSNENMPFSQGVSQPKALDAQIGFPQPQVVAAGGFKNPAKRTAFGDLSNTSSYPAAARSVSINGLGKPTVSVATTSSKMVAYKDDNKENIVMSGAHKDAFLRPAQRHTSQNDHRLQPSSKLNGTRHATLVYNDEQQNRQQKPQTLNRQYRSQPQLKSMERPQLRQSQSKHVIPTISSTTQPEVAVHVSHDTPMEELPKEVQPTLPTRKVATEPVGTSNVAESEPPQPVSAKGPLPSLSSGPSLPEHEEYWDEDDDEEYDEQGFTTANSCRSYGDNTTTGATTLIAPKKTNKVQKELERAKLFVEANRPQEDIDEEDWDVSMVAEYGEEIFEYMRELEVSKLVLVVYLTVMLTVCLQERMLPNPYYAETFQSEVQWSMRSILMDWLVQVHNRFTLLPETLFLTVNYIDRFLSSKIISMGKLQLVGATAIFVAAKYEEINCPSVQEIVFMVDSLYSVDDILKAERFMLSMLQFELGWPGPMSFLRRISKADDYDLETRTLAKYFLEVTIMDERFVGCVPSYLAAGAHCLARLMIRKGDWVSNDPLFGQCIDKLKLKSIWTLAHVHYSGYTWGQIKPLVAMLLECCQNPQKHHPAIYEKYCDRRFKKSAVFVQVELAKGFVLPFQSAIPRLSTCSTMDDPSAPTRFPPAENSGVLISAES